MDINTLVAGAGAGAIADIGTHPFCTIKGIDMSTARHPPEPLTNSSPSRICHYDFLYLWGPLSPELLTTLFFLDTLLENGSTFLNAARLMVQVRCWCFKYFGEHHVTPNQFLQFPPTIFPHYCTPTLPRLIRRAPTLFGLPLNYTHKDGVAAVRLSCLRRFVLFLYS